MFSRHPRDCVDSVHLSESTLVDKCLVQWEGILMLVTISFIGLAVGLS